MKMVRTVTSVYRYTQYMDDEGFPISKMVHTDNGAKRVHRVLQWVTRDLQGDKE